MYCVYRNQTAAAYLSHYFFIFLSNFLTIFFYCIFLRNCESYKVRTWYTYKQWVYVRVRIVYIAIKLLQLLIHPFILFIFLSLQFSDIKCFVALFSGTVRPRYLKLVTHVECEWLYRVYRNRAAAAYSPLY